MGNAVNFFDKDERGRCSEYESMAPAKIINGVKGHIIKNDMIKNDMINVVGAQKV